MFVTARRERSRVSRYDNSDNRLALRGAHQLTTTGHAMEAAMMVADSSIVQVISSR